jgi:hypothetical protein
VDAPAERPVLNALIYRCSEHGIEFQMIRADAWPAQRSKFLWDGWRFLGVDPADEFALAMFENQERSTRYL